MRARRPVAFAATIVTAVLLTLQAVALPMLGTLAIDARAAGACAIDIVSMNEPAAGMRTGDRVDMRDANGAMRAFALDGIARAGTRYEFTIVEGGVGRRASVQSTSAGLGSWIVGIAVKAVIFALGIFVLVRGRDAPSLAFGISSVAIAVPMYPAPNPLVPGIAHAVLYTLTFACAEVAAFALYLLIEGFARGILSARALRITRVIVIASLAVDLADDAVYPAGRLLSGCVPPVLHELHLPAYMISLVVTLSVLGLVYLRAGGELRQRLRWIVVSTAAGFSGVLVYIGSVLAGRPIPLYPIADLTAVAIPAGYAYAILRHHVIDVGFAVNRALVFTLVTACIFAIFNVSAQFVERTAISRAGSVIVEILTALAVAVVFDTLRGRVEGFVDRVFFRRKYEAQEALERLLREAPHVRSTDVLLQRTALDVAHAMEAPCAVYEEARDGSSYVRVADAQTTVSPPFPEHIPIDDPSFVALRAEHREIRPSDTGGVLSGAIVFPLGAGERTTGALVCGVRAGDETYDPDDIRLLAALARELSTVLVATRARESEILVHALADGLVDPQIARERARAITLR